MYIFIYSNHNINLRSSIANRIFLTMSLIATIVCAYRIIYMLFLYASFETQGQLCEWEVRRSCWWSLSLPLDERRADVTVIVGKSVHTANNPLLLDSRFAKKEKKNKKIKIRNTYRLGYSSKILAKHLEDEGWMFWIGSEGTKLYFRSTSTISVHARRLRYYLSDIGAAGIRFHLFSSFSFL